MSTLDWDDSDDTRTLLDHTTAMSTKSASDGSGARLVTAQQRKMALVADALEKTGMGRYQWAMYVVLHSIRGCRLRCGRSMPWSLSSTSSTPRERAFCCYTSCLTHPSQILSLRLWLHA
ncbi:hypothetical protein EXIGLDRAFT_317076 [Exidia glandulosa HHB12029]|uniref:Uncharacterized protein n=1 Tax=Exidia glandulosa HHB12029 TaxID=1314781 RepID=A0A165CWJ4_EXIGL|nr:hypothetical protein EXIGLDRAFT_317076 [Exidia glandulosa HHB12029]